MAIIKKWGLTYNDTCVIGEHKVSLPPLPERKDDILFINNKPEEASWNTADLFIKKDGRFIFNKQCKTRRIKYPDIWYGYMPYESGNIKATERFEDGVSSKTQATIWDKKNGTLLSLSREDTEKIDEIYAVELKRMHDGVFMRNGDEIEYLTPAHYTTLQWLKMSGNHDNDGYGFFLKFQRDVFYLLDHIWTIDWCVGLDLSKAKKIGATQIIGGGYFVWAAITHFQWILSMMSRSQPVANGTCFAYFLYAYNSLPKALMPKVAFLSPKGGDITFGERGRANVPSNEENALNTRAMTVPTMEHAFDSFFPMLIWIDEFPKLWADAKKEPKKILDDNINSIKDQLTVRGKCLLTSYPPEKNDKGAQQAKVIFYDSKLSTIKEGQIGTNSGFICYHVPGESSVKSLHDRLGNPLISEARRLIDAELKKVEKNKDKYLATLRVFAPDEKAAFDLPAKGNGLPIMRLIELYHNLQEQERHDQDELYVEGKLEWTNEMWNLMPELRKPGEFCPVRFVPLTDEQREGGEEGKLKIAQHNIAFEPNACLANGYDEWGNLLPPARFDHVGGFDPTQWAASSEVLEGSKNAGYTLNLPNDLIDSRAKEIVTNVVMSEYYFRTETPDESLEDLIKEIIFFSRATMVEGNAPAFFNGVMKEKLGYYMFVKDKEGLTCLWRRDFGMWNEPDKKYTSLKTTANVDAKVTLEEFISLYAKYFKKPVPGQKDYGVTFRFSNPLNQAINLDIENTKVADCFMALGYTFKAAAAYIDILIYMTKEDYSEALPAFLRMLARTEERYEVA